MDGCTMVLFSSIGGKLKKVNRIDFRLKKDIQTITEQYIDTIFWIRWGYAEVGGNYDISIKTE